MNRKLIPGHWGDVVAPLNLLPFRYDPALCVPGPREQAAEAEANRLGGTIGDEYTRLRDAMLGPYHQFIALLTQPPGGIGNPERLGRPGKSRRPFDLSVQEKEKEQPLQAQWVGLDEMYRKIAASRASTTNDPMTQLVDQGKTAKEQRAEAARELAAIRRALERNPDWQPRALDAQLAAAMFGQ